MKTIAGVSVIGILVLGLFAAVTYPAHPKGLTIFADSSGPIPFCDPNDTTCDRGPMFPAPAPQQPGVRADSSGPIPFCDPNDTTCDRGPMFPAPAPQQVRVVMLADSSGPIPFCDPNDTTCDRGPMFPSPAPQQPGRR